MGKLTGLQAALDSGIELPCLFIGGVFCGGDIEGIALEAATVAIFIIGKPGEIVAPAVLVVLPVNTGIIVVFKAEILSRAEPEGMSRIGQQTERHLGDPEANVRVF